MRLPHINEIALARRGVSQALLLAGAVAPIAGCTSRTSQAGAPEPRWVATWSVPVQLTEQRNLPPPPGLTGTTLRQVFHVSIGGDRVRLRVSNMFGTSPTVIASVHLARSAGASAIDAASDRALTFGGAAPLTIAPGTSATSDPIDFPVAPLSDLTVTMYITQQGADVTGHPGSRTTSYLQSGDVVTARTMDGAATTDHWYAITGLDVVSAGARAVVTLGNSITDGRGSGTNRQNRWPDNLARRLQADPRKRQVAVLNAGIGGNKVLAGGLGPTALARLDRDVLDQPGARWLIVAEGINDIGEARTSEAAARIVTDLIAGYQQIVTRARARGFKVYGATILPCAGSQYDGADREAARQAINTWIRTGGAYDAVIDFDAALRDPANPARLRPEADTGDHLHPNEAGYVMMADLIDLALFTP